MLHSLVVFPFYFFAALGTFLTLALASRVLRLKIGANALAITAVLLGLAVVAIPLALDWVDLRHMTGRFLLMLGALTFVLAALDTLLQRLLPSPIDRELSEF